MLDNKINIKWYNIIESTESTKKREGPHIKFKENNNWEANNKDKKIGAITLAGLGIIKISFDNILNAKHACDIYRYIVITNYERNINCIQ